MFSEYELKGRDVFSTLCSYTPTIYDYEFTQGKYDACDVYFMSAFTSVAAELKLRNYSSNESWADKGFILEKEKFEGLMKLDANQKFYIMILIDEILLWDLTDMNPVWVEANYQKTNEKKLNVNKFVTYLKREQASHIWKTKY